VPRFGGGWLIGTGLCLSFFVLVLFQDVEYLSYYLIREQGTIAWVPGKLCLGWAEVLAPWQVRQNRSGLSRAGWMSNDILNKTSQLATVTERLHESAEGPSGTYLSYKILRMF